jgi:hypothetical protein
MHEKREPSPKDLHHLPTPFYLAKKMGEKLGERQILQQTLCGETGG